MTTHEGRGFGSLLKVVYKESAGADVVSIYPSTEFILSAVEWARDDERHAESIMSV